MKDILYKTYPEDLFLLQRQIRMRKIDEYLMDSAIVANPHKKAADAKEFIEMLLDQRRYMRGEEPVSEQLDVAALERLKSQLAKESHLIKVK